MNLKEAFRYQNYLGTLFATASSYLRNKNNLVRVQQEHLRKSANPDAQDEVVDATTERMYEQNVDTIIDFMKAIIDEKYRLSLAVDKAKAGQSIDVDAETSRNTMRRAMVGVLEYIGSIKPSESKRQGSDYKFTATGEQASYYYNMKETVTIDFDRSKVKHLSKELAKDADETSTALDRCMIDDSVDFVPFFNVSDSIEDALESFEAQLKSERRAV